MITRIAIFEGRFHTDGEALFFAAVETRLAPLWRQFPHALDVRWFRITNRDATATPIVMIQQVDYPSHEAMAEALISPTRDSAKAITDELMGLLDGTFYHFLCEGGSR